MGIPTVASSRNQLYSPLSAWDTEILDNSMENMTNQMKVLSSLSRWEEIILNNSMENMANQTPTHNPNSSSLWDERTVNNSMGNMTNQTPTTHPPMQEEKKTHQQLPWRAYLRTL